MGHKEIPLTRNKNHKDRVPFSKPLIESKLSFTLNEFEGSPDRVVRIESPAVFSRFKMPDLAENIKRSNELFEELQEYNILVAPMERVIGEDKNGKIVVYTMAERIYGENLEQKKFSQSEIEIARRKLDDFYSSLIDYVRHKYVNGGYYLSDIFSNAQYVYGRRKEEEQDNVYLIDLSTKVGEYKPATDRSYNTDLSRCLWNIFQMIQSAEERLSGAKLDTARIKLFSFSDSITPNDPNYSGLVALKDWLAPIE